MNFLRALAYTAFLFLIPISLSDCSSNDVDDDPSDLVEGIFTEVQIQMNLNLWGIPYNANWGSLMVQYWTNPVQEERTLYNVTTVDFDEYWLAMFIQVLNPLRQIKSLVDDRDDPEAVKTNQKAIADILIVYAFHNLTDGFGDMPVLQFLDNDSETTRPTYDSQEAIYQRLLSDLDQALVRLDESAASYATGDIIYNGDVSKWKKFGYSLMLRMAMRIADVDASEAGEYVRKADGKVLTSNSDNATFVFSGFPTLANPFFVEFNTNNLSNYYLTTALIDQWSNTNDPRLSILATQNQLGAYQGLAYGDSNPTAGEISQLNEPIYQVNAPAILMDYAEVAFLLAEAYQRNIMTGDPANAYADGIQASMEYWGVLNSSDITDYIAANPYNEGNWRESIGTQKWLAFYGNGPQAWAEWRRLDYPELPLPAEAATAVIPVRLPYPASELRDNATQLGMVTSDPNNVTTKLWWDVN